jgi:hypothetical protein
LTLTMHLVTLISLPSSIPTTRKVLFLLSHHRWGNQDPMETD